MPLKGFKMNLTVQKQGSTEAVLVFTDVGLQLMNREIVRDLSRSQMLND